MSIRELKRDWLTLVKQDYLCRLYEEENEKNGTLESPSWGELASVDDIISDEDVFEEYDYVDFCEADFECC